MKKFRFNFSTDQHISSAGIEFSRQTFDHRKTYIFQKRAKKTFELEAWRVIDDHETMQGLHREHSSKKNEKIKDKKRFNQTFFRLCK